MLQSSWRPFVSTYVVIGAFIVGVFVFEMGRSWWHQNAWRRRWRDRDREDD
jgi:hypothetical protein